MDAIAHVYSSCLHDLVNIRIMMIILSLEVVSSDTTLIYSFDTAIQTAPVKIRSISEWLNLYAVKDHRMGTGWAWLESTMDSGVVRSN